MAHLIDKDALILEIRKRLLPVIRDKHYDEWEEGQDSERQAILDIINTIEVKEVNLEEEIKRFTMSKELYEADSAIKAVAEHFFELGLKTQKGE